MRTLILVTALTLIAVGAACTRGASASDDRGRARSIAKLADSIVAKGVPGIAIAVIRDGKPFAVITRGSADLADRRPVTADTPFQLASTTKLFSSAAVLMLVADGKIGLDDPVGKDLHGLPGAWQRVTVRQLLSHTSGLPDITRKAGELDLIADNWDDALRIVRDRPFGFEPGTAWAYNQTNYAILQRMIEQVSGERFEDFLAARLFRPLSMRNSFYPDSRRHCAATYQRGDEGRPEPRSLDFPAFVHGAGGLCSSLNDLIAWNAAMGAGKVLPPALVREMATPAKLADSREVRIAGPVSYGLGRAIDTTPGKRWAGHSGGNSTAFRRYLHRRLTIIVLHNGDMDPDRIASTVAGSMLDKAAAGGPQAALWDAARDGDVAAARQSLEAGADVNALDTRTSRNGRYALNWAAIDDNPDMIAVLLARGARIDAGNLSGFTALHHAAESASGKAAQALLAAGANPALRTKAGETAAEVARRNGNGVVADIIERAARGKR